MNEKTNRIIIFSVLIVAAIIIAYLGILLAVYNYEDSMENKDSALRDWKLHICCYGTCEFSDEELEMQYIIITVTVSLGIALGALATAIFLYIAGHDYYRCGRFECPEENSTG